LEVRQRHLAGEFSGRW